MVFDKLCHLDSGIGQKFTLHSQPFIYGLAWTYSFFLHLFDRGIKTLHLLDGEGRSKMFPTPINHPVIRIKCKLG